ncbi:MAG: metallophosphatase family protein [Bacteroidales bacterium]|nr:metallophosphatase family protein [Bacteroidales bacterium]
MLHIGILSDTHGYLPEEVLHFFAGCDEVWHAGDIGNIEVLNKLQNNFKVVRAVYGNIDGQEIRKQYPNSTFFNCESLKVFMTHIGGYPRYYAVGIKEKLSELKPKIFVCGHSHILRVIYDKELDLLHINPGASGKEGIHVMQTAVKITIDGEKINQLQVWEKKK